MVPYDSVLVALVRLVDRLPQPPDPPRGRGRPRAYPDRLFLKALVIMVLRRLPTVPLLLEVLAQATPFVPPGGARILDDSMPPGYGHAPPPLQPHAAISKEATRDTHPLCPTDRRTQ
jgi:hypothetical protein